MRYVAFLRAINVGGHVVKMDRLRALFEAITLANVDTFIASGNVIFDSGVRTPRLLEERVEKHLAESLGYAVATFIRQAGELPSIVATHPFAPMEDEAHGLYVGFLKTQPTSEQKAKLLALETHDNLFAVGDRAFYWLARTRMSDSPITGAMLERAVGQATLRNITSLRKLTKKIRVTA